MGVDAALGKFKPICPQLNDELSGTKIEYKNPTEPFASADWDALT